MWAELEKYNNHYLQKHLKYLEPQKINEMVNKEVKYFQSANIHCIHSKPPCKSANYFEDRAELAYGFNALPKLMKELGSDDYLTHFRAVISLAEYILNPLHAQRAITHFSIVRRCQNVFLRKRQKALPSKRNDFNKYQEVSALLDIFYYIAMHMNGANEIVKQYRLLIQFYIIIRDREEHMNKAAKILPFLSQDMTRVILLIDNFKVFDHLESILKRDICVPYYSEDFWLHLTHILETDPHEAINRGFFEILHARIKGRLFQYHRWDMKCFGLLLHCPEGQKRFVAIDGIKEIYTILKDEDHIMDSYENVIFTLMNGLMANAVLCRCREFTDLPLIIMKLSKVKDNQNQQLLCFQTLRELGEMPCIKRFIKDNCLEDLKNIECAILANEKQRNDIIYWLEREIYFTTDLRI